MASRNKPTKTQTSRTTSANSKVGAKKRKRVRGRKR